MADSIREYIHDVVGWLQQIEEKVGNLYTQAAEAHIDDDFSEFLLQLAEDEKSHAEFIRGVSEHLQELNIELVSDIVIDQKARDRIEEPVKRLESLLSKKSISKKSVLEYMVRAESSELNPVFLYVVGKSGKTSREAERMAVEIQKHLVRIQDFITTLPDDLKPSIDVAALPRVWESRFLVIDDNKPLRKLVGSLLARRGAVEIASDGREGLQKVKERVYDVIISDIHMPVMDGLEFYQRAVEYDSRLEGHFLLYSADINSDEKANLERANVHFLEKPFGLTEFFNTINSILRGEPRFA
jgi:CheY-like chemotaxis protein/rubrerythrin